MSGATPVARAVEVLCDGGLVGLPTETVYGLAADASNPAAVARIFAAKGRPADHPVIVHLAAATDIDAWAVDIPPEARALAAAFWPGPMTLILKRASHVLDAVTGGQDTVGLRVPSHPVAQAVLAGFAAARGGRPAGVAAPSANKFGRVSPTTAQHVRDEFGAAVACVLDGGDCEVGIESTIVDLSGAVPRVLRPGRITRAQVEAVLGRPLDAGKHSSDAPRHSGGLDAHYAPRTPTRVVGATELDATLASHGAARCAVLGIGKAPAGVAAAVALPADVQAYAHGLYAALRDLDARGAAVILVERPPEGVAWEGVNDRLRRAATGSGA